MLRRLNCCSSACEEKSDENQQQWRGDVVGHLGVQANMGALIITIGFWGPTVIVIRNHQNRIGNIDAPIFLLAAWS